METEKLSNAASRFALRSTTELVADKEPRPTKPAAVVTISRCYIFTYDTHRWETAPCNTVANSLHRAQTGSTQTDSRRRYKTSALELLRI